MTRGRQRPDMNLLSKLSIRRKLMLIVMVTSSAAGLLACTTFISYDLHVFRQTKLNQLVALADVIGANTTGALAFDDVGSATQTLRALRATPHVVSAAIYDVYGRRFATYRRDSAGKQQGFPIVPEERNRFSKDSVAVFRPIWLDGEKAGMVYVAADLVDVHERLVRYAGIVTLVAMGCLVIVYLLASRLQRSISEPILDLSNVMQSVANEKNSFLRATKHADDEIGRLADGFNHMLQQIELRENDLREARNSLEKRVEERTRELKEEIEERRRTEQALGQSEETTRLLLDSTAEAIYGVGMQGECTFANPSCLRMLGYEDAGDLLGKNLHELIHHTRADGTPYLMKECKLQEAFRLGVQRHVDDEVFWRRDGRSFPVEY